METFVAPIANQHVGYAFCIVAQRPRKVDRNWGVMLLVWRNKRNIGDYGYRCRTSTAVTVKDTGDSVGASFAALEYGGC